MENRDTDPTPSRAELNEPGPWLGHYTTAETAFEHVIPKAQLRMSPYRFMRDPAENKDFMPSAPAPRDQENPVQEWLAAGRMLKEARDQTRLLSLTFDVQDYEPNAKVFGCCWARARLWEQYADVHRGVCLIFNKTLFEESLRDGLGEDSVSFGEVEYTRMGVAEGAATFISDMRLMDSTTREQAVSEYLISRRQELFFLKSDDWATEYEFRAVLARSDGEYAFADYGQALVAVVVGERFPKWQVAGAQEICDRAGVRLARARWHNGRPYAGGV
jgi:hypothetical protein